VTQLLYKIGFVVLVLGYMTFYAIYPIISIYGLFRY
jgi:hypothetical protein